MSARRALVRVEHAGPVATLTLARPAMHNALVPDLLLDLCVALEQTGRRADTRAVVLAAEGEAFSIGGDMRRFAAEMAGPSLQTYAAELVGLLNQAVLALLKLPQPVVAAVHGHVTGGSLGLVLACDLAVMAEHAVFKAHYATAGFTPDGGWTALLPRLVGARRAAACLLLNRSVSAPQALDWGIVNELAPAAEVPDAARRLAERVAGAPVVTMRESKRLLRGPEAALAGIEAALEEERQRFVAAIGEPAAHQGVAGFLRSFGGYPDDRPGRAARLAAGAGGSAGRGAPIEGTG
ncbi:enoyl-CoA hydratase/isomerase family protein [Burkholderiaceae bacterium FT117]|uniref:enoyl-CoA hydratase/isomerase family protein n=1 Tax=Zeimonas sediminis TaxID=2944268 RepID=UPI0023430A18|nr:enoyl-CoA hydratase/isomerase family protein [Zeimonas sediminis]MCM5571147.1 enoyl-CoA hydratase/isomerase family protein [Zeimonas sediminis]